MISNALTSLREVAFVLPGDPLLSLPVHTEVTGRNSDLHREDCSQLSGTWTLAPETVFTLNLLHPEIAGELGQEEVGKQISGEIYRNRVLGKRRLKRPASGPNERWRLEAERQGKTSPTHHQQRPTKL